MAAIANLSREGGCMIRRKFSEAALCATKPVRNLWVISRRSRSSWLRFDVSVKGHFISQGSVFFQLLLREKGKRDFQRTFWGIY